MGAPLLQRMAGNRASTSKIDSRQICACSVASWGHQQNICQMVQEGTVPISSKPPRWSLAKDGRFYFAFLLNAACLDA